jgi:hypothetical protein
LHTHNGWHIGDPRANDADKIANEWLMRAPAVRM